ncbi:hypothetical protein AVEN_83774-1 [Araneus ventricosus]|uniref:Uncharacterized protein n=1 Tax=Araneus ventricosus TaxID=182803 RepID=A0A4Y2T3Q3_ARAVE|nr:hypothetical protein AVEN_83774-1 [Araneus ventricosus]
MTLSLSLNLTFPKLPPTILEIPSQPTTKARSTLARLPPTVDAARFQALKSYLRIPKWLGREKNPLEWGWLQERVQECLWLPEENVSDINLLENSIEDEDDNPSSINNFIYEDIEDLNLQLDEDDKEQQTKLEDFRPAPSRRQKL